MLGFAGEVLASLGGATVLMYALSRFLGGVWADRIAKATLHKFEVNLLELKAKSEIALETARSINQLSMEERRAFGQISHATYQDFFARRFDAYKTLLSERQKYLASTGEFVVDDAEAWGDEFLQHYKVLQGILAANQMYVSASLDDCFEFLREKCAEIIKDNNRRIAYLHGDAIQPEEESRLNNELYSETFDLYAAFVEQLGRDVKALKARIDLDVQSEKL